MSAERLTGEVKFFNENRGYGFIKPDNGQADVFVHVTEVNKAKIGGVREGTRVSFVLEQRGEKVRAASLQRA